MVMGEYAQSKQAEDRTPLVTLPAILPGINAGDGGLVQSQLGRLGANGLLMRLLHCEVRIWCWMG